MLKVVQIILLYRGDNMLKLRHTIIKRKIFESFDSFVNRINDMLNNYENVSFQYIKGEKVPCADFFT